MYGFPARVPAPSSLTEHDVVSRIAILAAQEGWLRPCVKELYRRWFQLGEETSLAPSLPNALRLIGQEPKRGHARDEERAPRLAGVLPALLTST